MNIVFGNKKEDVLYIVTEICFGGYKGEVTAYVKGGYATDDGIARNMPAKLYRCRRTGRPVIKLSGVKLYALKNEEDKKFPSEIMEKAFIK